MIHIGRAQYKLSKTPGLIQGSEADFVMVALHIDLEPRVPKSSHESLNLEPESLNQNAQSRSPKPA